MHSFLAISHPKSPTRFHEDLDFFITYAEFDFYEAVVRNLQEKLDELWNSDSAFPITEDELRHAIEIEEVISSSDNVVRFPEKSRVDDED
jgi:hypothetical protein